MAFGQIAAQNSLAGTLTVLAAHRVILRRGNIINTTAAAAYVQLFDTATVGDVTLGTTVPRLVLPVLAGDVAFSDLGDVVFDTGVVAASTNSPTGNTGATTHVRLVVV